MSLDALFASVPAFTALKLVGAAYLALLGVRLWTATPPRLDGDGVVTDAGGRVLSRVGGAVFVCFALALAAARP